MLRSKLIHVSKRASDNWVFKYLSMPDTHTVTMYHDTLVDVFDNEYMWAIDKRQLPKLVRDSM